MSFRNSITRDAAAAFPRQSRSFALRTAFIGLHLLLLVLALPCDSLCAEEGADEIAKDFYNSYLDSLPDPRVQRRELLEMNLVRTLKRILPGEDPLGGGPAFAETLQAKDLTYVRVDRTNPFVRGILKEIPHLKVEPFMFIVRAGPYLAFLCFRADPFRYLVRETDDYAVVRKKTGADATSPEPALPGKPDKTQQDSVPQDKTHQQGPPG